MAKIDRDLLNNLSSKATAETCYNLVEGLQGKPPHLQAAAAAAMFLTVCAALDVEPQEIFTAVTNMMADPIHGESPAFRALRLYAQYEIGIGR